jgi:hypothetical protein
VLFTVWHTDDWLDFVESASYMPPVALAQNQAPITKEVRAQSFTLIDPSDHTVGTFT